MRRLTVVLPLPVPPATPITNGLNVLPIFHHPFLRRPQSWRSPLLWQRWHAPHATAGPLPFRWGDCSGRSSPTDGRARGRSGPAESLDGGDSRGRRATRSRAQPITASPEAHSAYEWPASAAAQKPGATVPPSPMGTATTLLSVTSKRSTGSSWSLRNTSTSRVSSVAPAVPRPTRTMRSPMPRAGSNTVSSLPGLRKPKPSELTPFTCPGLCQERPTVHRTYDEPRRRRPWPRDLPAATCRWRASTKGAWTTVSPTRTRKAGAINPRVGSSSRYSTCTPRTISAVRSPGMSKGGV